MLLKKLFKNNIPIIHINSGIDVKATRVVENSLKLIQRPKAIAVVINSPGGWVVQAQLINQKIQNAAKQHNVPIYTFAEDAALSAGYFILAMGNKIFVDNSSMIGSIGVLMFMWKIQQTLKKLGIENRRFVSNENLLQGYSIYDDIQNHMNDKLSVHLQQIHQQFIEHVLNYRPQIKQQDQQIQDLIFNANMFNGIDSIKYGLADELGTYEEILRKLHPECELRNVTTIPFIQNYKNKQYI